MQTYISHDLIADQGSFGSVMERLFISSSGVALKIHEHDPLWVETIQKHVCLKSQYEESGELELGRPIPGKLIQNRAFSRRMKFKGLWVVTQINF